MKCPECHFYWIGDGPDKKNIENIVNDKKIKNITFLGETDNIKNILKMCDCYLSTSRWEGLPNCLLEAGFVGLPSIVTRVTGNIDVIIDGLNGFYYDLHDIEAAATHIRFLMENKEVCLQMGMAAENRIKKYFNESTTFDKYFNLYIKCIST
jgi:glycosyltransferase involved in cell wall biosynthesis